MLSGGPGSARTGARVGGAAPAQDQASRLRALMEVAAGTRESAEAFGGAVLPGAARARRVPVLAVASGKGGVGKSNIAVNLSAALAARGVRCTLLDADIGVANADVLCGLNPRARLDAALADPLGSSGPFSLPQADLEAIAIEAPGGFRLVPGAVGLSRAADLPARELERLVTALGELGRRSDVVIVDSPAGVGSLVRTLAEGADHTLVVVTPEPTSIADAYALVKSLAGGRSIFADAPLPVSVVVNQARDEAEARGVHARLRSVADQFLSIEVPLCGWVPADPSVPAAVRARSPVLLSAPLSPAAQALSGLVDPVAAILGLALLTHPRREAGPGSAGGQRPATGMRAGLRRLLGLS